MFEFYPFALSCHENQNGITSLVKRKNLLNIRAASGIHGDDIIRLMAYVGLI